MRVVFMVTVPVATLIGAPFCTVPSQFLTCERETSPTFLLGIEPRSPIPLPVTFQNHHSVTQI